MATTLSIISLLILSIVPVLKIPALVQNIQSSDRRIVQRARRQYAERIADLVDACDHKDQAQARAALLILCSCYSAMQTQDQEGLYYETFGDDFHMHLCRRWR